MVLELVLHGPGDIKRIWCSLQSGKLDLSKRDCSKSGEVNVIVVLVLRGPGDILRILEFTITSQALAISKI